MESFRGTSRRKIYIAIFMLLMCGTLVGCSVLGGVDQTEGDRTSDKTRREADDSTDGKGVTGDSDPAGDESDQNLDQTYFGEKITNFSCPSSPEVYHLYARYDVKFKTPQFGTWDIKGHGAVLVSLAEGLDEDKNNLVLNPGEVRIPGIVNGNFSRKDKKCSFSSDLDIITSAYGNCDKGVVYLNVVTNFTDVNTTITCCTGDDCDDGPFFWILPVVTHDIKLSAANGFTETKEFTGGSGTMTWELLGTDIDLVPIPNSD